MSELNSLPASVRQRLQLAEDEYEDQGPRQQTNFLQVAAQQLAQAQPEYLTLLLASQMGYRELSQNITEENTQRTESERRILGVRVFYESSYTTTSRSVTKTWRLGRGQ